MDCGCDMRCHLKTFLLYGIFIKPVCDLLASTCISLTAFSALLYRWRNLAVFVPVSVCVWSSYPCLLGFKAVKRLAFSCLGVCSEFAVCKWQTVSTVLLLAEPLSLCETLVRYISPNWHTCDRPLHLCVHACMFLLMFVHDTLKLDLLWAFSGGSNFKMISVLLNLVCLSCCSRYIRAYIYINAEDIRSYCIF